MMRHFLSLARLSNPIRSLPSSVLSSSSRALLVALASSLKASSTRSSTAAFTAVLVTSIAPRADVNHRPTKVAHKPTTIWSQTAHDRNRSGLPCYDQKYSTRPWSAQAASGRRRKKPVKETPSRLPRPLHSSIHTQLGHGCEATRPTRRSALTRAAMMMCGKSAENSRIQRSLISIYIGDLSND